MKRTTLTTKEQHVLLGLTSYPNLNDSELSTLLNIKLSHSPRIQTPTLHPRILPNISCPTTQSISAANSWQSSTLNFNPVIPLEKRIETTKKFIEVSDEIIYSLGNKKKDSPWTFHKTNTNIERINEIRQKSLENSDSLKKEYPNEVIFPFETSKIIKIPWSQQNPCTTFLDSSRQNHPKVKKTWYYQKHSVSLSEKQKKVFTTLVEKPNLYNTTNRRKSWFITTYNFSDEKTIFRWWTPQTNCVPWC